MKKRKVKMRDLPFPVTILKLLQYSDDLDTPVSKFIRKYTRQDWLHKRGFGVKSLITLVETIREETGLVMSHGDLTCFYGRRYLRLMKTKFKTAKT